MSKKVKWLLGIMLVGALGILATTFWVVDQLPGPTDMAKKMENPTPKVPHETHDIGVEDKTDPKAASVWTDAEKVTDTKSQEDTKQMVLDLLSEDPADIRVCDNLGVGPKTKKELQEVSIGDFFKSTARNNPILEAMRIPIKAVFQDEHVSSLMNDVMKVDPAKLQNKAEKDSLLKKLGFYSRAAATAAHMVSRKRDFEILGDRAIHLSVISRIASLKPELATDPHIRDACENMERSIIQDEKVSLKKERKEILSLIQEAGLTPEDLNFDPNAFIKFNMKFNDKGLHFTLSDSEPSA